MRWLLKPEHVYCLCQVFIRTTIHAVLNYPLAGLLPKTQPTWSGYWTNEACFQTRLNSCAAMKHLAPQHTWNISRQWPWIQLTSSKPDYNTTFFFYELALVHLLDTYLISLDHAVCMLYYIFNVTALTTFKPSRHLFPPDTHSNCPQVIMDIINI